MKPERRELQLEVKVLNAEAGICEYVASDQTLDYSREIILARGWRFTNFAKNAPFVDSHDYSSISKLLGKVIDFRVQGEQLIEQVQWAVGMGSELADWGWKLVCAGVLKSCSVGFVPTKLVTRWDSDPTAYVQQLQLLGLSGAAEDKKPRVIYQEQEQIELSACTLGCNPNALVRGYKDGALTEEDMVGAGFKTAAEWDFLTDAAGVYDAADARTRAVIHAALARIFPTNTTQPKTAPDAEIPGGAEGAPDRRGTEDFIAEFKQLTTSKS